MALAKTKKRKLRKKLFSPKGLARKKIKRESFSEDQIDNFKKILKHDSRIYKEHEALIIGVDEVGRGCLAGPVCTAAYSCSSFYANPEELIAEVTRSRQLVSNQFLNIDIRDAYYAETVINEDAVEEEIEEVEELSTLLNLEDSKKVSKEKREKLCKSLLDVPCFNSDNHLFHSVNFEAASKVDKNGIVPSIWSSMTRNIKNIINQYIELYNSEPERVVVLVDGPKTIPSLREVTESLRGNPFTNTEIIQIPIVKGDSKSSLIAAASNLAKFERDKYMEELSHKAKYANYTWARNVGYGTKKHLEAIMEHGITDEHRKSFLSKYINN